MYSLIVQLCVPCVYSLITQLLCVYHLVVQLCAPSSLLSYMCTTSLAVCTPHCSAMFPLIAQLYVYHLIAQLGVYPLIAQLYACFENYMYPLIAQLCV